MEETLWVNMIIVRPIIMAAVDAGAALADICAAAGKTRRPHDAGTALL